MHKLYCALLAAMLNLIANLTLTACFPLASDEPTIRMNRQFTIRAGREAVMEDGLRLRFQAVLEDSRCPKGVDCVWMGQARISIAVRQAKDEPSMYELSTNPAEKRVVVHKRYRIELKGLAPHPKGQEKIKPGDYEASFVVTSK